MNMNMKTNMKINKTTNRTINRTINKSTGSAQGRLTGRLLPLILAALLLLSLALAGCGGQGQTSAGGGAAAQTLWEQIQEKGVITVGNSPDYDPFEFEDGTGDVIGFDIDLLTAICGELGITYELVPLVFDNIETAVQTGQVNVGMSGFSITPARQETFDFSTPYFSGGQAVAVNPDSGYTTVADLKGKTITVGMSTSGMEAVEANIETDDVIGMDNYALAFMQLKNKGCDATVADLPVVQKYAARDGFLILDEILSYEDNAILIKKGNPDLVEALSGAIEKLRDDGTIDQLVEKWMVSE
ncbi:MAG: ABC transporter substrate-binding protein [Peptococcaceae bacterium]|jgi:polar amino acid transport system substrate-binding protein|nr:ABC transporter substrate-binding protein [Peptococcaceae bacterium]